jgi:AcrR family transcriptional regulator
MIDTRQKILDAAESLFGKYGYAATSLRHIISQAGVNLASIHYHFGSKQDLLDQVILRKAEPINKNRLKLLDQFEAEAAPKPASIEKVLEAFIIPIVMIDKSPEFVRLMGRMHAEGFMPEIARRHFQPVVDRFFSAIRRALPEMPQEELAWKAHFVLGAMAHMLSVQPEIQIEAPCKPSLSVARQLVAFASNGFRATAAQEKEIEVNR